MRVVDVPEAEVARGSQSAEAGGDRTFTWRGKTYKTKLTVSNGVNSNHSLEDIHRYVGAWPPERCGEKRKVQDEVAFQSIEDFVNTIRQSCSEPGAAFLWPSRRVQFGKAISVALHHLPTT